jgi:CheY-like chemotaxis protein
MPEGGTLTITTRNATLRRTDGDLEPADYVVLSVADTGVGMSQEVQARAFEPFYTTKEVGKGTGLGLSQVYGVARQLGGTARLRSAPGQGTTVEIYLPRSLGADEAREADTTDQAAARAAAKPARARILLVDDDPDAREVLVEGLRDAGYEVLEADSGASALTILRAGQSIDLLVTDYAMPGMNGVALVDEARMLRGESLKAMYVTGYADTSFLDLGPHEMLLTKPFRVTDLIIGIEAALGM